MFAKFAINSITDLLLLMFAKLLNVKCRDILCSLWIVHSKSKFMEAKKIKVDH